MLNKSLIVLLIVAVSASIYSCVGTNTVNYDTDLSVVTESGLTVVSSIADDASTGELGVSSIENDLIQVNEFTCANGWSTCSNGVKTRTTTCNNPAVGYTKDIALSFFNSNGTVDTTCSGVATVGNYVVKSGEETLVIPINGDYTSTSGAQDNYSGVSIGGGAELSKRADGSILMHINGITKIHTDRDGVIQWTNSVHSDPASPLVLNQLARNGRKISSGTIIVDHNESDFTAAITFNDVTYTTTCCYPVGGTITVTLSGSRTGTGTLTFSSLCEQSYYSGDISGETLMMISCSSSVY